MTNLSAHLNCVSLSRKSDRGAVGCCGCFWSFEEVMERGED